MSGNPFVWALLCLPFLTLAFHGEGEGYVVHKSGFDAHNQMRIKAHPADAVCQGGVPSYTGWADIGNHHLFFWYYESRNSDPNTPVMVWFTGGPGGSGQASAFAENGDCLLDQETQKPKRNPHAWTEQFHMVYIDQPVGVGFSYLNETSKGTGMPRTTEQAAPDVVAFLRLFGETFPHLAKNPLHLAGESYGGRWIPVFGDWVAQYNKLVPVDDRIPLASLIAMSAWTHPSIQVPSVYEVGCQAYKQYPAVYNDTACDAMALAYPGCEMLLEACDRTSDALYCQKGGDVCEEGLLNYVFTSHVNKYDRRVSCKVAGDCYPIMDAVQAWLNTEVIFEDLLEVTNQTQGQKESYVFFDTTTLTNLRDSGDMYMDSLEHTKSVLAENNIPILYTAGEVDVLVNPKGLVTALEEMRWSGRPLFKSVPYANLPFESAEGHAAGRFKQSGNLYFAELADAGHMSPHDQPEASLNLMRFWLSRVNSKEDAFEPSTPHGISTSEDL